MKTSEKEVMTELIPQLKNHFFCKKSKGQRIAEIEGKIVS